MNPNRSTSNHIMIKMAKLKRTLKAAKRRTELHTRNPPLDYLDFSAETLEAHKGAARYIQSSEKEKKKKKKTAT